MKTYVSAVVLLAAVLLSGCVSTIVTPLAGAKYPPVDADEVVIYLSEDDIPGEYEKVAIIYAKGDYSLTNEAQMFKSVRKRAAKLGANGVLFQDIDEPTTAAKMAHHVLGTGANRKGEMLAIFVRPGDPGMASHDRPNLVVGDGISRLVSP